MNSDDNDIWKDLLSDNTDNKRTIIFENSSILKEVKYDRRMQTLTVSFKNSPGVYSYFDIPSEVANALFSCANDGSSAGKYFIKHIKGNYPFKRLS